MSPCLFFTFTYWYLTVALYWPLCGFWTRQKTPTRGIHHSSMMDVHTKVLLSVENEIFLLHTNRRSVRIQTTFRPSPKVTLEPGTLLDSIQPRTLCLVPPTSVVRSVVCVHYVVLLYYIDPLLLWAISPLHEVKAKKYSAASKRNYSDYHSHMMQCSIFWACYIEFRKYANSADTNRKYLHV